MQTRLSYETLCVYTPNSLVTFYDNDYDNISPAFDEYAQCWYVTTWSLSPVHVNINCSRKIQKGNSWYLHIYKKTYYQLGCK